MNSTYAQKSSTVQKAADTKAASVLDSSAQNESLQRKADMVNNAAQRAEAPRPNNTGLPDNLKSGIESLSGFSMDDVRVHYNSSKPATVQALAYTQGTDIHVAPGQEKHLPHEAWHVAQQMAGRVSPTTNINGMPVNDNAALEHEADVMGEKAVTQSVVGRALCVKNVGNDIQLKKYRLNPGPVNAVSGNFNNTQISGTFKTKAQTLYGINYSFHHICPKDRLVAPFDAIKFACANIQETDGKNLFNRLYEVLEFGTGDDKASYNTGSGFFGYNQRTDDPGNGALERKPQNMSSTFYDNACIRNNLFQTLNTQIRNYQVDEKVVNDLIKIEGETKNKVYFTNNINNEKPDWEKDHTENRITYYRLKK